MKYQGKFIAKKKTRGKKKADRRSVYRKIRAGEREGPTPHQKKEYRKRKEGQTNNKGERSSSSEVVGARVKEKKKADWGAIKTRGPGQDGVLKTIFLGLD